MAALRTGQLQVCIFKAPANPGRRLLLEQWDPQLSISTHTQTDSCIHAAEMILLAKLWRARSEPSAGCCLETGCAECFQACWLTPPFLPLTVALQPLVQLGPSEQYQPKNSISKGFIETWREVPIQGHCGPTPGHCFVVLMLQEGILFKSHHRSPQQQKAAQ